MISFLPLAYISSSLLFACVVRIAFYWWLFRCAFNRQLTSTYAESYVVYLSGAVRRTFNRIQISFASEDIVPAQPKWCVLSVHALILFPGLFHTFVPADLPALSAMLVYLHNWSRRFTICSRKQIRKICILCSARIDIANLRDRCIDKVYHKMNIVELKLWVCVPMFVLSSTCPQPLHQVWTFEGCFAYAVHVVCVCLCLFVRIACHAFYATFIAFWVHLATNKYLVTERADSQTMNTKWVWKSARRREKASWQQYWYAVTCLVVAVWLRGDNLSRAHAFVKYSNGQ